MCRIEQLMKTCRNACQAGGAQLKEWQGKFSAQEKAEHDFVTDADIASQEAVKATILAKFPEHGFLGEESPDPAELDKPFCWIVDPLDGTTNYVHGFPCYAVSVGVAQAGKLVAGGVYDPVRDEMFLAGAGQGATLNGQTFLTRNTTGLASALVAVSFPPQVTADMLDMQAFQQIVPLSRAVRRTGSAALNLAYVACGRLDAHWAYHIHPWDAAAGVLLVAEAQGVVSSVTGGEFDLARADYLVAASEPLHRELCAKLPR